MIWTPLKRLLRILLLLQKDERTLHYNEGRFAEQVKKFEIPFGGSVPAELGFVTEKINSTIAYDGV